VGRIEKRTGGDSQGKEEDRSCFLIPEECHVFSEGAVQGDGDATRRGGESEKEETEARRIEVEHKGLSRQKEGGDETEGKNDQTGFEGKLSVIPEKRVEGARGRTAKEEKRK